jgi:hypothetical protein
MKNNISEAGEPDQIVPRNSAVDKPAECLSVRLQRKQRQDVKNWKKTWQHRPIPRQVFSEISKLGRGKYRAIVVATIMANLHDGWKGNNRKAKKARRRPTHRVLMTRRLLAKHFGMPAATAGRALADLVKIGVIVVSKKAVYSKLQGKSRGTEYRMPWMEPDNAISDSKKKSCVCWGLLTSDAFQALSAPVQATLILLHTMHHEKQNSVTIMPCALESYGIHRNRLADYVSVLVRGNFLIYVAPFQYQLGWIDGDSRPDFRRIEKISMHLTDTSTAPN